MVVLHPGVDLAETLGDSEVVLVLLLHGWASVSMFATESLGLIKVLIVVTVQIIDIELGSQILGLVPQDVTDARLVSMRIFVRVVVVALVALD